MALLNRMKVALGAATAAAATTFNVGAAASGFQTPASAGAVNGTTYSIVIEEGSAWFAFVGTYVSATPAFTVSQAIAGSAGASAPAFTTAANLICTPLVSDLPAGKATAADLRTGTDDIKFTTAKSIMDAMDWVTLTDAATVAVDFNAGLNFKLTLGGNRTLGAPSNAKPGESGCILITQDGTGSRTLAYNSAWKFPGGAPTLSAAAGSVDMITYVVDSASVIRATLLKGFA